MQPPDVPILQVKNLRKSFGSFEAVKDVSFQIYPGDVFGFLGPNGAGKSTTIRCMTSLIRSDSGSIQIFGKDLKHHRNEILSRIGCIIEKPDFYKYLSAETNLKLAARLSTKSISLSKIYEMLEFVGLKGRERDKVGGYSQGMKQRLGLAQALLHDPELIILDEPTNGLDPQGIVELRTLILQLRDEHRKTILLSSHQLSEIELIANRMVIINKGNTVVEGAVADLLHADELLIALDLGSAQQGAALVKLHFPDIHIVDVEGTRLQLSMHKERVPQLNRMLVDQGIEVFGIESRRKLEEFFITMINS